jgi:hypothetical protein
MRPPQASKGQINRFLFWLKGLEELLLEIREQPKIDLRAGPAATATMTEGQEGIVQAMCYSALGTPIGHNCGATAWLPTIHSKRGKRR